MVGCMSVAIFSIAIDLSVPFPFFSCSLIGFFGIWSPAKVRGDAVVLFGAICRPDSSVFRYFHILWLSACSYSSSSDVFIL